MALFFTSDTHFGHNKILQLSDRPFDTVEAMDQTLIHNWNDVVAKDDEVWILGDYAMGDRSAGLAHLRELNGTKYLISGNHDRCSAAQNNGHHYYSQYLDAGFAAIYETYQLKLPPLSKKSPSLTVMLSHYPYDGDHVGIADRYQQLRLRDTGTPLLHGHVHEEWIARLSQAGTPMINVGVDRWGYAPVPAETLHRMLLEMSNDS